MGASFQPGVSVDLSPPGTPSAHPSSGITLVDVMFGLLIISTSLLGLCALFIANERTNEAAVQQALITNSLRDVAETMRSTPFSDVVSNYQGYTFTDPQMLSSGVIKIYVDETDTSPDALILGFPRDLDGDGLVSKTNVTPDYNLVAIRLNLTFPGAATESLYFFLSQDD
ncbi:MAG: hypothetical protein V3T77_06440 [Planctomycetota bacterium]